MSLINYEKYVKSSNLLKYRLINCNVFIPTGVRKPNEVDEKYLNKFILRIYTKIYRKFHPENVSKSVSQDTKLEIYHIEDSEKRNDNKVS